MKRVLGGLRRRITALPGMGGARKLRAKSIWGHGSVSVEDARLRTMLRHYLPEFYLATAAFGLLGFVGGVPALRQTFGNPYAEGLALLMAITAITCLIGAAFPERLWRVEFVAVSVLIGLVVIYALAVYAAGFVTADLGRSAVGAAIWAMSALPRWRRGDIVRDRVIHGWK